MSHINYEDEIKAKSFSSGIKVAQSNGNGEFNKYKLKIIGDGPMKNEIISYVKSRNADVLKKVGS